MEADWVRDLGTGILPIYQELLSDLSVRGQFGAAFYTQTLHTPKGQGQLEAPEYLTLALRIEDCQGPAGPGQIKAMALKGLWLRRRVIPCQCGKPTVAVATSMFTFGLVRPRTIL